MVKIDEKNCIILNLLQQNCRMSLTDIAKKVGLSVDSVKKRVGKMLSEGVFYPKIQLRPRTLGFKNIVDVKIKLHNHTTKDIEDFVSYLQQHPRVAEIFIMSGSWNFSIVFISKDFDDMRKVSAEIQNKFGKIINEWVESLTTGVYKFEEYDLLKLINPEKKDRRDNKRDKKENKSKKPYVKENRARKARG
ncbi:MAG TPA: Lrp/AsnC family transcriptional regulator [Candidatus Nanoarchaeia archaeon]|nr:Lrp/AsnC family transcriptional regulator [Candidatus Nanoarchaeia archaeon]